MRREVASLAAEVFVVPTDGPEADGTATWDRTTVVVVRAQAGGVRGTGWTYGPAACAAVVDELLAPVVIGADAMAVTRTWRDMVRAVRNATRAGAAGYAISAVDVALWDLKARLLDLPLADLWGRVHDVDVYGSGGFTSYDDDRLTTQLRHWVVEQRLPRVKIKIGEDRGRRVDRDRERMRLSRNVIGPDVELFVDANGAYTPKQAIRLMRDLRDLDVGWFEEPVSSDDAAGLQRVREGVAADVAAGEYGSDLSSLARLCPVVDCLQIDATRCGGYTEFFRASAVAAAHQLQVSAHCAPNLHASVAACAPNARHVEWFHDHERIESELFTGHLDPRGGTVRPADDQPGHGLALDEAAAQRYRSPDHPSTDEGENL